MSFLPLFVSAETGEGRTNEAKPFLGSASS